MYTIAFLLPRSLNLFSLNEMQITRQIFYQDVFYWFWEEIDYHQPEQIFEDIKLALQLVEVVWIHQLSPFILEFAQKLRWIHTNLPYPQAESLPSEIKYTCAKSFDSEPIVISNNLDKIVATNYSRINSQQLKLFIKLLLEFSGSTFNQRIGD